MGCEVRLLGPVSRWHGGEPGRRRKAEAGAGHVAPVAGPRVLTSVGHHDFLDGLVLQAPDIWGGGGGRGASADAQDLQAPTNCSKLQHLGREVRTRLEQPQHRGSWEELGSHPSPPVGPP